MTASAAAPDVARELAVAFEQSRILGAYATDDAIEYVLLGAAGAATVARPLDAARTAHAFSQRFPLLAWDEREMASDRGVIFDALPDPRPFFLSPSTPADAVVAKGEGLMHVVVGPVHAGVNEPGRFTFSTGGETIVHLDAQLSFTHRGVERRLEGLTLLEAAPYVARICGSCSASRSLAYARAVEALAGIDAGDNADAARVVIAELERIYNHLSDLAGTAAGAGYGAGHARGLALKEEAMRLNARASGHRLLFDAIVPGGIAPHAAEHLWTLRAKLAEFQPRVERYVESLFSNASLVSRWQRAGIVEPHIARAFGAVGPALRACDETADIRITAPYAAYRRLGVRAATAASGDVFARCAVKRDEIAESFRLAAAALAELRGPFPAAMLTRIAPQAVKAAAVVEGPRGAETVALHADRSGVLRRAHVISASYRNWPLVAPAMDGNIIPDFPLVNHSFSLCYACTDR